MQIRHNLVVSEKPSFRRGCCVAKAALISGEGLVKAKLRDFRMRRRRIGWALAAMTVSGAALAILWPHAHEAGNILAAQDDPVKLSDIQIGSTLQNDQKIPGDQIEAALAANDPGLAQSFVDLASEKHIAIASDLSQRVSDAVSEENSSSHFAKRFASDLFVFGDIRDVVRESKHLVMGEDADRLVLGLATAGLAVTAATYVSFGGAAPVRAGLTLVKDARKVGRLGEGLTEWAGRSARGLVDAPMLQNAVASGSVLHPGQTVSAIKAAFHAEKAGALVRLAKDVGRVGERAGARGALDTLRIAEGPEDVARAALLAQSKGGQTRAILKLLGRGALLLVAGAFDLSLWVLGAVFALFGLLASIKATAERLTQSWLDRRKARRLREQLAGCAMANGGVSG
jgi:hypothetical protein